MLELKIDGLSKTYPNGVRALIDVTLDVPTGMFGLLGPNGAGKSTLMRTIATLQEADAGSIVLEDSGGLGAGDGGVRSTDGGVRTMDGGLKSAATQEPGTTQRPAATQNHARLDVLRQKDEVRRILGYLPQEFGIYPRITAQAMLSHFAVLKGITNARERKEVVDALLHRVNLWDVRTHHLGTFSGGMRQRFGIAQALIGSPQLIIVDEPTAGLDPGERVRFHNLLSEIGQNVVVILSTHIVDDVSDLCSRMAIISNGRVLMTGDPAEAVRELEGKIWRRSIPKPELERYQRDYAVIATRLVGGRTVVHVFSDASPGEGFEPAGGSLEDVYFSTLHHAARTAEAA